ncbi:MAG: ATP-dependent DNA ligase [Myxococcota bacterium]
MLLDEVVSTSTAVAATRSRTAKTEALSRLIRSALAQDAALVRVIVPWLAGEMRQGRIGVGYAAVFEASKTPAAAAPSLTVAALDARFDAIRDLAGPGSQTARKAALVDLFARATAAEHPFLAGLLVGELRQGALDGVMADAVAAAAGVDPAGVRRAAMLSGNLVAAAVAALDGGDGALAAFQLELFRPIQPMLAQTAEDVPDAFGQLGPVRARFEVKLDGVRIQVHRRGDVVQVWSRALLPITDAVPEVVEAALALAVDEIVLDGEVLALGPGGRPLPFQVTMRRFGRKLDLDTLRVTLPLTPVFFDLLHVDGRTLVDRPLAERVEALTAAVPEQWRIAAVATDAPEVAAAFLADRVAAGHEGVMAKGLDTLYEAGRRGVGWLKIKPTWTLDLVVLAAEWGSGRRKGWLSNLHLGARDPGTGRFVMLGKTFKGLTDEQLAWQTTELLAREQRRDGHVVVVRPELVVEIAFNEVQASPRYPGGVALRFARVKGYRIDKSAAEADTIDQVRAIFGGRAPRGRGR